MANPFPQSHPKHVEPRQSDDDADWKLACDDEPLREMPTPEALPKPRWVDCCKADTYPGVDCPDEYGFQECASCRAKSGSPTLCAECLRNRAASREVAAMDMVNHPPHYTHSLIEPIEVIDAWKLSYCLGTVVAYLCRADHKGNRLQDLEKAAWFLKHEIERERKLRE